MASFNPVAKGQRPPVGGVQGVEIHIDRCPAGTADAGDKGNIVLCQANAVNSPQHTVENDAVAATGAPDMGKFFVMAAVFF